MVPPLLIPQMEGQVLQKKIKKCFTIQETWKLFTDNHCAACAEERALKKQNIFISICVHIYVIIIL